MLGMISVEVCKRCGLWVVLGVTHYHVSIDNHWWTQCRCGFTSFGAAQFDRQPLHLAKISRGHGN